MKHTLFQFLIAVITVMVYTSCNQPSQPDQSCQLALDSLKKQFLHVQDSLTTQLEYCRMEAERVTEQYETLLAKTSNTGK